MMDVDASTTVDVTVLPLAMREAAFFESADCYTAMIANREVIPRTFHGDSLRLAQRLAALYLAAVILMPCHWQLSHAF